MKTKVIKIGGSCLSSAEHLQRIIPILQEEYNFVLVVSAFRNVTNLLERWFDTKELKHLEELKALHKGIFSALFPEKVFELDFPVFQEVIMVHLSGYDRNHTLSLGEKLSSAIVEMYLREKGIPIALHPSDPLIVGDSDSFDRDRSVQSIKDAYLKKEQQHLLTQGFASFNHEGGRSNLGREGSDLTAVLWAHALGAECILYKDVGALYHSDPRHDSEAQIISQISFDKYKQDFYGAQIIYEKVVDFCLAHSIPLSIYSIENNTLGTYISIN